MIVYLRCYGSSEPDKVLEIARVELGCKFAEFLLRMRDARNRLVRDSLEVPDIGCELLFPEWSASYYAWDGLNDEQQEFMEQVLDEEVVVDPGDPPEFPAVRTEGDKIHIIRRGVCWSARAKHMDIEAETAEVPWETIELAARGQ